MATEDSSQPTPEAQPKSGVEEVRGGDGFRKYFTQTPNLIYDLGLSPYAGWLYGHLLRVAGEGGKCWKSTRVLAEETRMSTGKVSQARAELEEAALIHVQRRTQGQTAIVTIIDIWDENMLHFTEGVQQVNTKRSQDERKNNPGEEYFDANASRPKPDADEPKVVAVEKHVVDEVYAHMQDRGLRLPTNIERNGKTQSYYKYQLGRAKDMLAKDKPTDEEIERLPEYFHRHYAIRGWADPPAALGEMRRQKQRDEILGGSNGGPGDFAKRSTDHATPPEVVDAIFGAASENGYVKRNEDRLRTVMGMHDFTSAEPVPWQIEKLLGGTDNERWSTMDALNALVRKVT